MPRNLENSAVATGLEKVSFHPNPKEWKCQRMFKLWRKVRLLPELKPDMKANPDRGKINM